MTRAPIDWAHTQRAEHDRTRKAEAVAAAAQLLGYGPDDLVVGSPARALVRDQADLRTPTGRKTHPSEETWHAAAHILRQITISTATTTNARKPLVVRVMPGWEHCAVPACPSTSPVHPYPCGPRCDDHAPRTLAAHARAGPLPRDAADHRAPRTTTGAHP